MEVEMGAMQPQAVKRLEPPEAERGGRTLPPSMQNERGPAGALVLDFQPPGLSGREQMPTFEAIQFVGISCDSPRT